MKLRQHAASEATATVHYIIPMSSNCPSRVRRFLLSETMLAYLSQEPDFIHMISALYLG